MLPYTLLLQFRNFISVLEPILVEDINDECVPKTYENLREYFEKRNIYLDRSDVIVLLLYICMLEMGFVAKDFENICDEDSVDFNYNRILKLTQHFPENWKTNDVYEFSFTLLPFPLYTCNLTIVKISDDMLINCSIRNIENCANCILIDPSLYVVSSSMNVRKIRFQNVRTLSTLFKSKISYPMKVAILTENDIRPPHLQTLPVDVLFNIVQNFNCLSTLARFQQVCHIFKDVTDEEKLWKTLIDKECTIDGWKSQKKMRKANKKLHYLKSLVERKKTDLD